MNALQKVAWMELLISVAALGAVLVLYPWLGDRASGAFGLLGLLGLTPLLMVRRNKEVVSDERDRQIAMRAMSWAFGVSWLLLLLSLLVVALWCESHETNIPTKLVFALLWLQFVLVYAVKGGMTLRLYGDSYRAT